MTSENSYGQPIGPAVADWSARSRPGDVSLKGRFCRLEPLSVERHAGALFNAYAAAPDGRDWTYLAVGPFADAQAYRDYATVIADSVDPKHYAVVDAVGGQALGTLSLMRINPEHGVIEVGNVIFSPQLQRTPAATEAQFLLMGYIFDQLGYRRYEWKCDSLNAPSRRAAQRLGFQFEGIFRQAVIYKGRSRDTAWYAVIDRQWPALKAAFQSWLSADNFDGGGRQRRTLEQIRGSSIEAP